MLLGMSAWRERKLQKCHLLSVADPLCVARDTTISRMTQVVSQVRTSVTSLLKRVCAIMVDLRLLLLRVLQEISWYV
jgi:hypothetical protein